MIRLRQVDVLVSDDDYGSLRDKVASKLRINSDDILEIKVVKRSVDARRKPVIYYSYVVDVEVEDEDRVLRKNKNNDIFVVGDEEYEALVTGDKRLINRPIIIGAGPCGLFCAYMLASYGYKPLVIDRGMDIDSRVIDVEEFWNKGILKKNSNVQFGLGGAGTFSDGKLNTLVKDKNFRQKKVFEILVENGAPEDILYDSKPHIGTDILRTVVKNIRNKIILMGGEFRFNTCFTDFNIENGKLVSIVVNDNEIINTEVLVLAIGHSARDTFEMLYNKKVNMEAKPFAVGVRIQHNQEMINMSQYGVWKHDVLGEASYKLTYRTSSGRGVYTFCMCPGGYVVNASSEEGRLAVNGMSNRARESGNANSAVIVTVSPDDYGYNPLDGVCFQRELESRAYQIGKGMIPVSLFGDYLNNKVSSDFGSVKPVFKGGYCFGNVNDIFPDYINDSLKEGISNFGKKIAGFDNDDAIICGVESRTSSPVRIIRNEEGMSNYYGIYPSGEGAGYAGGITSAAIDGLVTFEKIISVYKLF